MEGIEPTAKTGAGGLLGLVTTGHRSILTGRTYSATTCRRQTAALERVYSTAILRQG